MLIYRVSELLDYTADELTGKNLYTLCHGEDANRLRKSHIDCKYFHRSSFTSFIHLIRALSNHYAIQIESATSLDYLLVILTG